MDPYIVECINGQVTGVASNVTAGFIKPLDREGVSYRECYVMAGEPAIIDEDYFVPFVGNLEIQSDAAVTVYLIATSELKEGPFRVRVDI